MPKVSIITPLYNGSKTLTETAESVLAQDFRDWEWIFFDDGSTDNTAEIAGKLAEADPARIKLFMHEGGANHGTAYTRNRAFEKSQGEIIAFIDQDDIWYGNRLSHQLKILDSNPACAMVWSPALYWYADRTFVQPVGYRGGGLEPGVYDPPSFIRIFLSDLKGTPLPSGSLLRRSAFGNVKGYEESIRGSEDIVLWLKIARDYPVYFDNEVLIKYRKHHDSTLRVAKRSGKMDEWDLVFYRWVGDFLRNSNAEKTLIDENDFAYYRTLKRVVGRENYFNSRKLLLKKLREYPDLGSKFTCDYLLDLALPFDLASKVSAKIRFDILGRN
ncbi:MAG: glycosyltransferase family 2 protein [Ignavibacteria bacterium]|nr:glycosyltransferase family 2 protein [Ignavibacteria bacterium]